MPVSDRARRGAARASCGIAALCIAGAAALFITHPSAAQAAIAAVTTVTCSLTGTSACITGADSSSGIGVLGSSNTGTGVRGMANSNFGIKGSSGSSYGVFGTSTSGFAGIAGTTANGYGLYGYNTGNGGSAGVYGSSTGGYGVTGASGDTYGVFGTSTSGGAGVAGSTFNRIGVYGYTTTSSGGTGVYGSSTNGFGVEGSTSSGTGTAVYGYESGSGNGVLGISSGYGLVGVSGEDPLVLENASGTAVAFINSAGDIYYHGGLHSFALTSTGATVSSFSPKAASPTVEDTGSAQLVAGSAAVRLDPTFAASIDPAAAYRVFITPDGDTPHGLFVAAKTAAGFIVREAQGGRSTVSFDYRIVATALGQTGQRMAAIDVRGLPHAALPSAQIPHAPTSKSP